MLPWAMLVGPSLAAVDVVFRGNDTTTNHTVAAQLAFFDNKTSVPEIGDAHLSPLLTREGYTGCANATVAPPSTSAPPVDGPFTWLVERGDCTYAEKWEVAAAAANSASPSSLAGLTLLVRNTRKALYRDITNVLTASGANATYAYSDGSCAAPTRTLTYDCDAAQTWVPEDQFNASAWWALRDDATNSCKAAPACASEQCIATGVKRNGATASEGKEWQLCCMWDKLVIMGGSNASAQPVRAAFVGVASGENLLAAQEAAVVETGPTDGVDGDDDGVGGLDPASLLLWALGVAVALGGSYAAAEEERAAYLAQGGTDFSVAVCLRGCWDALPSGPFHAANAVAEARAQDESTRLSHVPLQEEEGEEGEEVHGRGPAPQQPSGVDVGVDVRSEPEQQQQPQPQPPPPVAPPLTTEAVAAEEEGTSMRTDEEIAMALAREQETERERQQQQQQQQQQQRRREEVEEGDDEEMVLTMRHALCFIIMASTMLLVLFYLGTSGTFVVNIFFCIVALATTTPMLWRPLCTGWLLPPAAARARSPWALPCVGIVNGLDVASFSIGLTLVAVWYANRLTASWAWVLQDVFGTCLCVSFLQQLRLPNVKVAGTLLTMAFLYDIFFVFITPLIFGGRSVMIDVVTGGAGPGGAADSCSYGDGKCAVKVGCYDWCARYPSESACLVVNDFLRLLLMFPRLSPATGTAVTGSAGGASVNGFAMLGLGDIVLPSLLLAFALRLDYVSGRPVQKGYFIWLAPGYAIGLLMANLAVVLMRQGQPALLYLVPCTLGVMLWISRGRKELEDLWRGPPALTPPYFSASLLGMSPRETDGSGGGGSSSTDDGDFGPMLGAGGGTIAVLPPLSHDASREEQNSSMDDGMATI